MKRKSLYTLFRNTALAVPAAALMLGQAQAGTTVGLNFQDYYYNDGGAGYQTTGMPVTANAFGVDVANWFNSPPLSCGWSGAPGTTPISTTVPFGGTLSALVNAPNAWQSGIGLPTTAWVPVVLTPGNDEVTWGYISSGYGNPGANGAAPSVSVSGLAAKFPSGYVIQTIASHVGNVTYNDVDFTDGVTTNTSAYSTYIVTGSATSYGYGSGAVGLSAPSAVFTADTINIKPQLQTSGKYSVLAGFIITDQPVISRDPVGVTAASGATFSLSANVIGIADGLHYQWRLNGADILGANSSTYTKVGATVGDSGNYSLVVTNISGAATSGIAVVTVPPTAPLSSTPWVWKGNVNGTWDTGSTANWTTNGLATTFANAAIAQFDDTTTTTSVSNAATVLPYAVNVTNNTQSYILSGGTIYATDLTKSGTNTLTLLGNDVFTGTVAVDNGTLNVGNGGTTGSISTPSTITVASGATLAFNLSSAFTALPVNALGNLSYASGAGLTLPAGTYGGNPMAASAGNQLTVGGNLVINAGAGGATITGNSAGTGQTSAAIYSTGQRNITSTGNVTITGDYTGGDGWINGISLAGVYTATSGTLTFDGTASAGSAYGFECGVSGIWAGAISTFGNVVFKGTGGGSGGLGHMGHNSDLNLGPLTGNGTVTLIGRAVGLNANSTFTSSGGLPYNVVIQTTAGDISGLLGAGSDTTSNGNYTVTSAGSITLGNRTINAGAGTISLTSATGYSVTGNATLKSQALTLGDGNAIDISGSLTLNTTNDLTIANAVTGAGGLTQNGPNTLTLNGVNTYYGATTVGGGTLNAANGSLGTGPVTVLTGGTLVAHGTNSLVGALTLNAGATNVMHIAKSAGPSLSSDLFVSYGVTYGGNLTVTASGDPLALGDTFTLFNPNGTYAGTFTSFILPALAAGLSWDTTQLSVNGSIVVTNVASAPVFNPVAGGYVGAQSVTISTLTPGGTIHYSTDNINWSTTSSPATVLVPVNTANLTIWAYATAPGYIQSTTQSAAYSTVSTPTWVSPYGGAWSTVSSWSNNVVANHSGLTADFNTLTLPADTYVTLDLAATVGGLVFGDQGNTYSWTVADGAAGPLTLDNGANTPAITVVNTNTTISAVLTGTQGFIKAGAGSLTLSGNNTYTGDTTVSAGSLVMLQNFGAFASSAFHGTVTVNTNAMLVMSNNCVGWGGGLTAMNLNRGTVWAKDGLGAFGVVYNLTGGTIGGSARMDLGSYGGYNGAINSFASSTTSVITNSNAEGIRLRTDGGSSQTSFVITTEAGSTSSGIDLLINNAGITTGTPGQTVIKAGAGTLSLGGVSTYTGGTIVSNGTLVLTGRLNGSGPLTMLDGTTLKVTAKGASTAIVGTDMTLGSSGACTLGFDSPSSTTVAPISVANVTNNATVTINITGGLPIGQLPLIKYSTALSGTGSFTLGSLPAGVSATLVDNTANKSLDLNVTAAPASIIVNLSGGTNYLYAGANYTLAVVAGGDNLTYLWKKNGTTTVGGNSPTLTIPGVTAANDGSYSVTVSNSGGSVQSATNYLVVLPVSGYDAIVIAAGPTAYWPLNETSGTTALDLWGNHNASYLGTYTLNNAINPVTGASGAHFDGGSGRALTPYAASLNPTVFTAEAWVNPDAVGVANKCVLSCGQFASPRSGWLIYQQASAWELRTYYGNGTSTAVALLGATAPVAGTWTHLAVTWDGTTARLYVNGVLDGSQAPSTTPKYLPGASGGFCVASRADNSFWWPGTASDAALYNRVLTLQEIQSHANNRPLLTVTPSGSDLILSWPAGTGALQAAPEVTGTYTNVPAATSPYTVAPTEARKFFRLVN